MSRMLPTRARRSILTALQRKCVVKAVTSAVIFSALAFGSQAATQPFTQQGPKLVGTGAVGAAQQGTSVAVSSDGNTAIVDAPSDNGGMGAAWVFTRTGSIWTQQGPKLVGTGTIANAGQGSSVALSADGNTAIVGGPNNGSVAGGVWVFSRGDGVWTQQAKLLGAGAVGSAGQGTAVSVSGDGNTIIIGGPNDNTGIGAAWIFTRNGATCNQQGSKLVGTGANTGLYNCGANQVAAVALSQDGNTAMIGAPNDDNQTCFRGGGVGASWVFAQSGGVWGQQGSKLVGSAIGAKQGYSVPLSGIGDTAVVGGITSNDGGAGGAGIFVRKGGVWSQQGGALNCAPGQSIGFAGIAPCSVALSADGNTAILGGADFDLGPGAASGFP